MSSVVDWYIELCVYAGPLCALRALFTARSPQGSIAWVLTLALFPWGAVPAYLVFGRNKFDKYRRAHRARQILTAKHVDLTRLEGMRSRLPDSGALHALDDLARMPFSRQNDVELLVNGEATFARIFDAIDEAQKYLLVQFYILRDDDLGRRLLDRLAARARDGLEVYFLYDEVGSRGLRRYCEDARDAGIQIRKFNGGRRPRNPFRVNFRNHRKIVVADGRVALLGGHNVGDEYLGKDPKFGPWRDTHVRIEGPMAFGAQLAFAEDWNWSAGVMLEWLDWTPHPAPEADLHGVVLPSGPADERETCSLMFAHLFHTARERIWIATPYFVPDEATMTALELAVLRDVDVKVIVPKNADSRLVQAGAVNFLQQALDAGIEVLAYTEGFMHQKVTLIDDVGAAIGTANLDNRSFRLNFEITAIVVAREFASEVEAMLIDDMKRTEPVHREFLRESSFFVRLGAKIARLFAPIL